MYVFNPYEKHLRDCGMEEYEFSALIGKFYDSDFIPFYSDTEHVIGFRLMFDINDPKFPYHKYKPQDFKLYDFKLPKAFVVPMHLAIDLLMNCFKYYALTDPNVYRIRDDSDHLDRLFKNVKTIYEFLINVPQKKYALPFKFFEMLIDFADGWDYIAEGILELIKEIEENPVKMSSNGAAYRFNSSHFHDYYIDSPNESEFEEAWKFYLRMEYECNITFEMFLRNHWPLLKPLVFDKHYKYIGYCISEGMCDTVDVVNDYCGYGMMKDVQQTNIPNEEKTIAGSQTRQDKNKLYFLITKFGNTEEKLDLADSILPMKYVYWPKDGFADVSDCISVTEQEKKRAAELYKYAADFRNPYAQCKLGYCYEYGFGVEQDYGKAACYYHLAADKGNQDAQLKLGYFYEHGLGVEQNHNKKETLAYLGYCYEFADGVEYDELKAFRYYSLAADQGNAYALYKLGYYYEQGKELHSDLDALDNYKSVGLKRNMKKAIELYISAADKGNVIAQARLGEIYKDSLRYSDGTCTKRDIEKSIYYYALAANQRDEESKYALKALARDF